MIRARRPSAGFTLIEAIMVIVITGILVGVVAVFITNPVRGYVDAVRRAELTDQADVALRRITRDVRLALPNSLRVKTDDATNYYIEFIMTSGGGRYRDLADGSTGGDFLSFTSGSDLSFHVLGKATNVSTDLDHISTAATPLNPDATTPQDYIVVYNLGPGYSPANAYNYDATTDTCPSDDCNIARASSVSCASNPCTVTLTKNPFAGQSPPLPSPNSRFQVVPGGVRAVTYVCPKSVAGSLNRQSNYGFNLIQAAPSGGSSALLAANATCTFDYTSASTGRNGLLFVQITLTSGGESVTLFQQIHVDNSP